MRCDWCQEPAILVCTDNYGCELYACRTHHSKHVWGRRDIITTQPLPQEENHATA